MGYTSSVAGFSSRPFTLFREAAAIAPSTTRWSLDIVIVMMFTYPIMTLLVRTKFFGGGHRLSGMDPEALGRTPSYRGRGVHGGKKSAEGAESNGVVVDTPSVLNADETSLTLAERRAAARRAAKETVEGDR